MKKLTNEMLMAVSGGENKVTWTCDLCGETLEEVWGTNWFFIPQFMANMKLTQRMNDHKNIHTMNAEY